MVFADQSFHIHGAPTQLQPVHVPDQWLPARHIFLAHAASLRRVIFFKTLKSTRLLHSFNRGAGQVHSARLSIRHHGLQSLSLLLV
jgi:hypothetical protein